MKHFKSIFGFQMVVFQPTEGVLIEAKVKATIIAEKTSKALLVNNSK